MLRKAVFAIIKFYLALAVLFFGFIACYVVFQIVAALFGG